MKKIFVAVLAFLAAVLFAGCGNDLAEMNYNREARSAKYQSEYAVTVNKLEMKEGNFKTYRRVVFYNVRLGETVFACEGFCHVQADRDGFIEVDAVIDDLHISCKLVKFLKKTIELLFFFLTFFRFCAIIN